MMVPTIKFDDFDSLNDLEMTLLDYHISPAKRKTKYLPILARMGDLDITTTPAKYENRTITMNFHVKKDISELNTYQYVLESKLNGKRMKIVFSNDPNYYWDCRIHVDDIKKKTKNDILITIVGNAHPLKFNLETNEEVPLCIE